MPAKAPAAGQLPENAKVGGQLDVVGNVGEVAHHVMARGRSEGFAGGESQFDVTAQLVDSAAPPRAISHSAFQVASSRHTVSKP